MTLSNQSFTHKKFSVLQNEFRRQLPVTLLEIEALWSTLTKISNINSLKKLQHIIHRLADVAGTYGAEDISFLSRKLDLDLKLLLDADELSTFTLDSEENINNSYKQLTRLANEWLQSEAPEIKTFTPIKSNDEQLVYTLLGDDVFSEELTVYLEGNACKVEHFYRLDDIKAASINCMPSVIFVDVDFNEKDIAGVEAVSALKSNIEFCPPVIYISTENNPKSRLDSVRAGVERYFYKPVAMDKILHTLQGLCSGSNYRPYRALVIDNDVPLLECYTAILNESFIIVESVSDPLKGLDVIESFRPDVILIDMYMPGCSGSELVHMIRQDDRWELIPIIFLSAEQDINNQLEAISLGADDFLVKPVHANKLISSVNTTAKRARQNAMLNQELKNSLRENKFQLVALDQHAVVSTADIQGNITDVNDKLCEISGYSRDELIGHNHRKLKSDYHHDLFYKDLWNTISSGKVWHGVICNKAKNGSEYWVDSTIVPFLDENGIPYKYTSVRTDVTELRENEQRLKQSQAAGNIGSWDWLIGTDQLYWSDHIWSLIGYKKSELDASYENFLKVIHPDDKERVIEVIARCIEHGEEYSVEHRVVWPDDTVHWVQETGKVVCNKKGEPQHMLGLVQNIETRKSAEIALAETQQQLLDAQKMAKVGNWYADIKSGELIWSDEIYRIFGHQPGSFTPSVEAFHAAVHPDDLKKVNESETKAKQTGCHDVVHRIIRPDNNICYVHELAKAEIDLSGQVVSMSGTVQDVTKLVQAENWQKGNNKILELIALGKPLEDILENLVLHAETMLPDAICSILLLDKSGKFLTEGVAPGLPDFYNAAIDNLEIGMGVGSCGEAAFSGKQVIAADIMTHPNWIAFRELAEKARLYACWSKPFSSTTGVTLGTFAIYFPKISVPDDEKLNLLTELAQYAAIAVEHHRAQIHLMSAKEEAENANRTKSKFLSSMSHELRTPMNAIMGFSQLLKMAKSESLTDVQKGNVNEIIAAGTHLMNLINEVLDLAKIEAGDFEISVTKINLSKVIKESLCLIFPSADKRGIKIIVEKDGAEIDMDDLSNQKDFALLDVTRFKQIVLNLMSNAVKYNNEQGSIIFSFAKTANKCLRLSVSDTGNGLSQEQQNDLFKSFNRLGFEQTNIEGTGIGLVITKKIVEHMGGDIGVNSEVGVGSTFWVELPINNSPLQ